MNRPVAYADLPAKLAEQQRGYALGTGATPSKFGNNVLARAVALLLIAGELLETADETGTVCVRHVYPSARVVLNPELKGIIRERLRAAFPDADFEVKSASSPRYFSVVRVMWNDAATVDQVRRMVRGYNGEELDEARSRHVGLYSYLRQDGSAEKACRTARNVPRLTWRDIPSGAELVRFVADEVLVIGPAEIETYQRDREAAAKRALRRRLWADHRQGRS